MGIFRRRKKSEPSEVEKLKDALNNDYSLFRIFEPRKVNADIENINNYVQNLLSGISIFSSIDANSIDSYETLKKQCVNAIKGEAREKRIINQEKCIKCGTCINKCPFKAIG